MNLSSLFAFFIVTTGRWQTAFAPIPTQRADWQRTVIFLQKHVAFGQFVFLRGGLSETCTHYPYGAVCHVPIRHRIGGNNAQFNAWKTNDQLLDWYGSVWWAPESDQGRYNGQAALGTPMVWTTNNRKYHASVRVDGYGYTELNTWGEHYWMVDVDMDCSKTEDGWFELKGIGPGPDEWELDITQVNECQGTPGGIKPRDSRNHLARCGYLNKFTWNASTCLITELD